MRTELKDFVADHLLATNSFSRTLFSSRAVSGLLESHHRGEACSKEIFSLLVLELWHAQFMSAAPCVHPPERSIRPRSTGVAFPAPAVVST